MGDDEKDEIIEEEEAEEGEEKSSSGEGGGTSPLASKIVKILLYVAGGILLIVLVTGISYLVSKNVQESNYEKRQDIIAAPPPEPLASFDLQSFSRSTADAEPHFFKLEIVLAYDQTVELNNELVKRKDQMRHIINIILQGKKYEDLNSVEDTVALAEEIKAHINVILINGKVKEVYFKDLMIQ